jgi:hypothetical protein
MVTVDSLSAHTFNRHVIGSARSGAALNSADTLKLGHDKKTTIAERFIIANNGTSPRPSVPEP